jgi:SH3-like domain-containing protein
MFNRLSLAVSIFLLSLPASAAVFTCSIQKVPPIGFALEFKTFTFDTADVPAEKVVNFQNLRLTLQSDGKWVEMRVSNTKREVVTAIPSYESEIYLQLDEDAVGTCATEDAAKGAIPLDLRDLGANHPL